VVAAVQQLSVPRQCRVPAQMQWPLVQLSNAAQVVPQEPQLAMSASVLVQAFAAPAPQQTGSFVVQAVPLHWQAPATQVSPRLQPCPHMPQLTLSF